MEGQLEVFYKNKTKVDGYPDKDISVIKGGQ